MAKRKKKSRQLFETISQNGSVPEKTFLKVQKVDLPEGVEAPAGSSVFTVGGSEIVAFHVPGQTESREKIFVRGYKRYPNWLEMSSAAQLFKEGTWWVAAPEPNQAYMVALLDVSGMVDKGLYDQMMDFLMCLIESNGGKSVVDWNEYKKIKTIQDAGGGISFDTNPEEGTYLLENVYGQEESTEA